MAAIGIDLGTTFSCVAVLRNDKIEVIVNQEGHYETPSHVTFTDDDVLIGGPAKEAAKTMEGSSHIFNAKRLIGRSFDEWNGDMSKQSRNWPLNIVNIDGTPSFKVGYKGRQETFTPVKIASLILGKLRNAASDALAKPVKKAVITVPAYFNSTQRQATEEAAKSAGLEVLRLCSEPVMAVIAYQTASELSSLKTVLVFDCGGGTTDIAIVRIQGDGSYDVKATSGDMNLGGETLVDAMMDHFLEKIRKEDKKDFAKDAEILTALRDSCESAKRQLSQAKVAMVCFSHAKHRGSWKLSRTDFESMCAKTFDLMTQTVEDALKSASMTCEDINEVLMVGGTSRIPALQDRLRAKFGKSKLRHCANPDHAIAEGAAYMAAILSGAKCSIKGPVNLHEIAPLSIGVRCMYGEILVAVPRNSKLPFVQSVRISTADDDQSAMMHDIYEGERVLASDLAKGYLGTLPLRNLPMGRAGTVKSVVTFTVSASGILEVSATEETTQRTVKMQLTSQNRQRDAETVRRMVEDAEINAHIDVGHRQRLQKLLVFREHVYSVKHEEMDANNDSAIINLCEKYVDWIDSNSEAGDVDIPAKRCEFDEKISNLRR